MKPTTHQQPTTIMGNYEVTGERMNMFERRIESVWDIYRNFCGISIQHNLSEYSKGDSDNYEQDSPT